jgi:hypothetical protein
MALGALGFAAGWAFARFISEDPFKSDPAGRAWAVLIGVNGAAWCVLSIEIVRRVRAVERLVRGGWAVLASTLACFAVLFSAPFWPPVVKWAKLPELVSGDYVLSFVGGLVAGSAMVGMWRVHAAARSLRPGMQGAGVELYLTLQDHLQALLRIVGAIITLATLAFAFAMKALGLSNEVVWIYGLYYTAVLALSYTPTHAVLVAAGHSLRDDLTGGAPRERGKQPAWLRERHEVDALLRLDHGPVENLKAGIFVMIPLLTSLVSAAFPKGS